VQPEKPCETSRFTVDSLIILSVLAVTAVYYYGMRAAAVILIAVLSAAVTDICCAALLRKKGRLLFSGTPSAAATGLLIALILPAAVPYGAVIIGSVAAIALLRYCLGSFAGRPEIINPAAGALLFLYYTFPARLSVFTPVFEKLALSPVIYPSPAVDSFFGTVIKAQVTTGDFAELLTGRLPSVLGGCVLVTAAAAIALLIRRDISLFAFLSSSAVFLGISILYTGNISVACYAFAGVLPALIFTALPSTARFSARYPGLVTGTAAKTIYGILLGSAAALFVWYSKNEYGGFFAAVILSPLSVYFSTTKNLHSENL
jgi:Na+-translocating ferredoxin:NAD+ oxidoreductase RnfD subunit